MCLNTGTPKNINFSFETNGKLMALGVPILKHFRVRQNLVERDCCKVTCGDPMTLQGYGINKRLD